MVNLIRIKHKDEGKLFPAGNFISKTVECQKLKVRLKVSGNYTSLGQLLSCKLTMKTGMGWRMGENVIRKLEDK